MRSRAKLRLQRYLLLAHPPGRSKQQQQERNLRDAEHLQHLLGV
jgi:hypothetical protein